MPDPGALMVSPDVKFTSKIGHPSPQHEELQDTWCMLKLSNTETAINGRLNLIFFIDGTFKLCWMVAEVVLSFLALLVF